MYACLYLPRILLAERDRWNAHPQTSECAGGIGVLGATPGEAGGHHQ